MAGGIRRTINEKSWGLDVSTLECLVEACPGRPWRVMVPYVVPRLFPRKRIFVLVLDSEVVVVRWHRWRVGAESRLWQGPKAAVDRGPRRQLSSSFIFGSLRLNVRRWPAQKLTTALTQC